MEVRGMIYNLARGDITSQHKLSGMIWKGCTSSANDGGLFNKQKLNHHDATISNHVLHIHLHIVEV